MNEIGESVDKFASVDKLASAEHIEGQAVPILSGHFEVSDGRQEEARVTWSTIAAVCALYIPTSSDLVWKILTDNL